MATLGNTPRPAYVYDTETDTWVPVGVGAHTHSDIPNTLVDAKGDLITATADNVPARLAKGADGTVLVSDSTTSTGLAWQPYASQVVAGKNAVINGGFDIWQRGTSSTATGSNYVADRWNTYRGGSQALTVSRQLSGISGIPYCIRLARNSGDTGTGVFYMNHSIESSQSAWYAGQQVTFSFYARAGENFTGAAGEIYPSLLSGTGTDQSLRTAYTGQVIIAYPNRTLTTSWQRFTTTGTVPSNSNQLGIQIAWTVSGTAGASDYVEITGAQIEIGSVATPFSRAGGTIQGELAACQRYYYKFGTEGSSSSFFFSPLGMANATTQVIVTVPFPQVMRAKPSSIDYLAPRVWDGVNTAVVASSLTFGDASTTSGSINANGSGFTLYRPYWLMNNSGSYIGFNAEL